MLHWVVGQSNKSSHICGQDKLVNYATETCLETMKQIGKKKIREHVFHCFHDILTMIYSYNITK